MSESKKPNVGFWVISSIALIWNLMGVDGYLNQTYKTERFKSMYSEEQLEIIDSSPNKRKIVYPTKVEVETAFKSYTERIKLNKIPSLKVYNQPEVNVKIEELYQMFLSLAR